MDPVAESALRTLTALVTAMIPSPGSDGMTRSIRVMPSKVSMTGLGAYIGLNDQPQAALYGRRIKATTSISVAGGKEQDAQAYLDQAAAVLLSQDQNELRAKGIFRLSCLVRESRTSQFELLYEYVALPTVSERAIRDLELQTFLNDTPYQTQLVCEFSAGALTGSSAWMDEFLVADDPGVNQNSPASRWELNTTDHCVAQNAATRGGPLDLSMPRKAGAQLLWRPISEALALDRFVLNVVLESADEDGIGLVFNRVDDQNFCYFLASQRHQYHLFGRKRAGIYSFIGTPNNAAGFELNHQHELDIVVYDGKLRASLNGRQTLAVDAGENLPAGEAGFLTHGNNGARFYRARAIRLIQP